MNGHVEKAFLYRHRAEELRVIAFDMKDAASRELFQKMAFDYDRLALIQDQLATIGS